MNMICKFLHYIIYTVKSPVCAQYTTAVYVQAENEEHATLCVQDYFSRHSMTADIISVRTLPHFLIANQDHYPKSTLYEQSIRPFDEALDLP